MPRMEDLLAEGQGLIEVGGVIVAADLATQAELDAKAPLASPTFTGTPAAPTAAAGTNTTQIATTAFVTAASTVDVPFMVDAGRMTAGDGVPSFTVAGTMAVVTLDPASTESVVFNLARRELPESWTTARAVVMYAPNGLDADGVVRWRLYATRVDLGDDYAADGGSVTPIATTDANVFGATRTMHETTLGTITLPTTANGILGVKVSRWGAEAADTHTADMWLYGVRLEKVT